MPSFRRKEALARAAEDTRSYYWLGFQPSRREDDAFHDLKVNLVGRPDLRVRTARRLRGHVRGTARSP